jgi:hypothetical protein
MYPAMSEQLGRLEARANAHDNELEQIRSQQREDRDEVRGLRGWIIATLATVCAGTIATLVAILTKKAGLS